MFLSKIWFFLVALVAAAAITVALVMPRPAQRAVLDEEQHRLVVACGVVDILLTADARNRLELTGTFARAKEVVGALESASGAATLDEARMKTVRDAAGELMKTIQAEFPPDFAILIDRKGRVVARVRLDENDFGDVMAGRPLVDDALAGYLGDDLWVHNGSVYLMSAAPVVKRDPPVEYVGAVVLGHNMTNALAQRLVKGLDVDVGFYLGKNDVAGSKTIAVDQSKLVEQVGRLTGPDLKTDCDPKKTFEVSTGKENYTALVARLPGEAGTKGAFYNVLLPRAEAIGFTGTLKKVTQNDLGFGNFPWILVGGGFVLILGVGIALMFIESDRPLKKLATDAVRLGKGETERLSEDAHPGKFGSIARSVNIHIDKLGREAKSAKKDLDQLLGPAPEGSLGTIDLLATALPPSRPGGAGPAAAPPPSEFKFTSASAAPGAGMNPAPSFSGPGYSPPAPPTARPGTPPPIKTPTPPPMKPAAPPPPPIAAPTPVAAAPSAPSALSLDDDILGGASSADGEDPYFKEVYDQFVAMKQSCGEPTAGLTYAKFAEKLVKNREDLMSKTGCKDVRFTVYVKEGKAALKATPVKEE